MYIYATGCGSITGSDYLTLPYLPTPHLYITRCCSQHHAYSHIYPFYCDIPSTMLSTALLHISTPATRYIVSPTRTGTPQSPISTPLTVRSLKRQAECLRRGDLSSTIRRSLDTFIKGSLVQAHAGAQAQGDLPHTQAAEIARASRQKRSRRRYKRVE